MINLLFHDGNNMSGVIPVELKKLEELKYLDLSSNTLKGKVHGRVP